MKLSNLLIEKAKSLYSSGLSMLKVSQLLNIKYNDLRVSFDQIKFPRRKIGESRKITSSIIENQIISCYQNHESIRQLAKKFNVDRSVIIRVLIDHNIQIRGPLMACRKKILNNQLIIDLYQSGQSASKIAKQMSVTPLTILRILKKHNICIRNTSNTNKCYVPSIQDQHIISLYVNQKLSCSEIAKQLYTSHGQVSSILKKNNIPVTPGRIKRQRYTINEYYFKNITSPAQALVLGLMFTDGTNRIYHNKYHTSIELQASDKHILEFVKNELNTNKELSYVKSKNTYVLNIQNKIIATDLAKLGCLSPKSLTLKYPCCLPENLFPHFLHGCIIGDGSIIATNKTYSIQLCGSYDLLSKIRYRLTQLLGVKGCLSQRDNIWVLCYGGRRQALKICGFMFRSAPTILERKFQKYQKMLKNTAG